MSDFTPFTSGGPIDPFAWTEARNFGAVSARRPHTQYRSYAVDDIEWQKSVYDLAERDHADQPFDAILDIGCGAGSKSLARFGSSGVLLQVDRTDFRGAEARAAAVPFRAVSFDSWDDLDALLATLDPARRTLIICSDVVEHLHDPRPLISFLRQVLLAHPDNVAFLSTPDHERIDGGKAGELPSNLEHVRQWSIYGMGALLRSAGFSVAPYGLVPMNEYDRLGCTILAKLTCSPEGYAAFLTQAGLPEAAPRLLVTCEHKMLGRGGGIGTYAYQSEIALDHKSIVLLFGQNGVILRGPHGATHGQYLHVGDILRPVNRAPDYAIHDRTAFELLDATKMLVFFYPDLRYLEFEDYQGCAHAIAQARRSTVLPSRIKTICYGHGNHHYLEVNHSRFFFDHSVHARERICLERADVTLIPSEFLSSLYRRAGLKPGQELRMPYPYKFQFGMQPVHDYQKIRRIVFFGKRTRGKGYHLFGEAINQLTQDGALSQVDEIVIAGVGNDSFDFAPSIAAKVRNHIYPNDMLVTNLHAERADTLAVIPYLGDNFPYSIHELLDAGVQTIFARAGGIPEVLGDADSDDTAFFAPKSAALAARLREKLTQPGMVRGGEIVALRHRFVQLQMKRNEAYRAFFDQVRTEPTRPIALSGELPAYDVVITFHNEESRYLLDALHSLSSQIVLPAKVVVVNDASRPEPLQEIEAVVAAYKGLDIQIVTPEHNLGLAEARNFGVTFTTADYVIAHDVDNMLRSDAVEKMLATLIANPDAAAASCHSVMFSDHENWIQQTEIGVQAERYEPIGPDLGEFEANTFGDALAMYRRTMIDRVGGWRNSGVEPLEDFELFYTLQAEGLHVMVIPTPVAMYRVRFGSMLRTYDRFAGYRRLADVITRRLGRDGLSVVRHAMEARDLISRQPALAAMGGVAPGSDQVRDLALASLPARLRDEAQLIEAVRGRSWKTVAWRHPFKIRYWQTLRRLQRAAKHLGLRP